MRVCECTAIIRVAVSLIFCTALPILPAFSSTVTELMNSGNGVNVYYVNPNAGSDSSGSGTRSSPWKTICKAINSGSSGPSGWTIVLQPGTYSARNQLGQAGCSTDPNSGQLLVSLLGHGGISGAPLTITGTTAFGINGAKIVGALYLAVNYTNVLNLEITDPTSAKNAINIGSNGETNGSTGQHITIRHNYIHDVNRTCGSGNGDGGMGVGTASDASNGIIDSNILNNFGVNGGCPGQAGTGPLGVYVSGYKFQVINNLISNAQGGIQFNHNVCDELAADNTVIHNYIYGILVAGWDGNTALTQCESGDNYTAIVGNFVAKNGYGCGIQYGSAGAQGGIIFWGIGANSTHDSIAYNYLASNWAAEGASGCTNSPGTANNIITAGNGYSSPDGNPDNFKGCGPPSCANSINANTNLSSTSINGLVQNFQNSVVPAVNPALGGTANFTPLISGPLHNIVNRLKYCPGTPGVASPCGPTVDIVATSRPSTSSIGAYEQ